MLHTPNRQDPYSEGMPSQTLGLAALLDAAAHGDMAEPEQIVEYASGQIARLSDALAAAISDRPQP